MDNVTCRLCGRGPATEIVLRRHVGMVVMQKFYKFRAPLCREHGRTLAKEYLGKTVIQGWWGVVSFFVNFYAVFTDVKGLVKASKLGEPGPATAPG